MLREAARARGFRLVKSRRRKPGGDFGRYGLIGLDSGRECLGFGPEGLTAAAEEVHAYLRGGEVAAWKRSLIGVVPPASSKTREARPSTLLGTSEEGAPDAGPSGDAELPPPAPEPPTIREATRRDAAALAKLLGIPAATFAERLAAAIKAGEPPLIAARGDRPVGVAAWTILSTLREGPRGRITLLMVAERDRLQGIGSALLAAVEQRMAEAGVAALELLLDIELDAPARFLRRTGWARVTSGYGKPL